MEKTKWKNQFVLSGLDLRGGVYVCVCVWVRACAFVCMYFLPVEKVPCAQIFSAVLTVNGRRSAWNYQKVSSTRKENFSISSVSAFHMHALKQKMDEVLYISKTAMTPSSYLVFTQVFLLTLRFLERSCDLQ